LSENDLDKYLICFCISHMFGNISHIYSSIERAERDGASSWCD
jgi:hypothetical protein